MNTAKVIPLTAPEEAALVLRAKSGSEEALAQLFERFQPAIVDGVSRCTIGFSNESTVEDLRSEARLALLEAVQKYQPSRGTRFGTLVRLFVRRRVIDAIRKLNRFDSRCTTRFEAAQTETQREAGYEVDFARLSELGAVGRSLSQLPDHDRELLVLRFERQMSLPEIVAAVPGRYSSTRQVSARIRALVSRLRENQPK